MRAAVVVEIHESSRQDKRRTSGNSAQNCTVGVICYIDNIVSLL
jgi:hypothetical protein